MSGERGASTADLVMYLGSFLIHDFDHLSQRLNFSFGRKYFDMHLVNLDFFQPV